MAHKVRLVVLTGLLMALGGCFDDDPHVNRFPGDDGGNEPPPTVNTPPTIAGSPPTVVVEGEFYEFVPTANDADGDVLRFSVYHKPEWANFDQATGRLWGTPDQGDVGTFANITIAAWDGMVAASLDSFSINVDQVALGSATLSWNPPTQNSDGSPLTDLAGYKIYYGTDASVLGRIVPVSNPGLTRYVVDNLRPATWYFKMTSVNSQGVESDRTGLLSKTIS